jgi:hypothetical protein
VGGEKLKARKISGTKEKEDGQSSIPADPHFPSRPR